MKKKYKNKKGINKKKQNEKKKSNKKQNNKHIYNWEIIRNILTENNCSHFFDSISLCYFIIAILSNKSFRKIFPKYYSILYNINPDNAIFQASLNGDNELLSYLYHKNIKVLIGKQFENDFCAEKKGFSHIYRKWDEDAYDYSSKVMYTDTFYIALNKGHITTIRNFIKWGKVLTKKDLKDALLGHCKPNSIICCELIDYLINNRVDWFNLDYINIMDFFNMSIRNELFEVAAKLISFGCDINRVNRLNVHLIHSLSRYPNHNSLEWLLKNPSIDIHAVADGNWNAMHFAAWCSDVKTMEILLEYGIDPSLTETYSGYNIFHLVIAEDNESDPCIEKVKFCYETCPELLHQLCNDGNNPLYYVEDFEILEFLFEKGAHIQNKDYEFERGILESEYSRFKDMECVELYIKNGLDVNYKTRNGKTILMKIIEEDCCFEEYCDAEWNWVPIYSKVETIQYFLDNGLTEDTINSKDVNGNTVLHMAIDSDIEVIRLLLKNKANIYIKNNNKETSIDIAKKKLPANILNTSQDLERSELVCRLLLTEGNLF